MRNLNLSIILIFVGATLSAQQISDVKYKPEIKNPAYEAGSGPLIYLDEGHNNFHTLEGRYKPFKLLLERDGYVLKSSRNEITSQLLNKCKIFIISDPMSEKKKSAYSENEIIAMRNWVKNGGSLFLITDHMPDPPAIKKLAEAFGITVQNSYVFNSENEDFGGKIIFSRKNNTLGDHPITYGRSGHEERINSVTSFTGSAFKAGKKFIPLMTFGAHKTAWLIKKDGKFPKNTPKIDVEGWFQGGVQEFGKGRLAFFSEAGMFTAQIIGPQKTKFGMNVPDAKENSQFLLNIMHWLSGII